MGLANFFRSLAEDVTGIRPGHIDAGVLRHPRTGEYWTAEAQRWPDESYTVLTGRPHLIKSACRLTDQHGWSISIPVSHLRVQTTSRTHVAGCAEAVRALRDLYDQKIAAGFEVEEKGRDLTAMAQRYPVRNRVGLQRN